MKITFDPNNEEDCYMVSEIINFADEMAAPATTAPITTAAPATTVDKNGVPWNAKFHAATKNKTAKGLWKRGKGVSVKDYDDFAGQFSLTAPTAIAAPGIAAPGIAAPATTAPTTTAPTIDMLSEIDDIFADLSESGSIGNFSGWVSSMLDWAKPGAVVITDLTNDPIAQQTLLNELKSKI